MSFYFKCFEHFVVTALNKKYDNVTYESSCLCSYPKQFFHWYMYNQQLCKLQLIWWWY